MSMVFACDFPDHLWFDVERDVWILPLDNGLLRLGMTDPAQTRSGKVLHVRARAGKTQPVGKSLATIESGKWVGPFPAPVAGTVVNVNSRVLKDPNLINRDPYGEGWLVEIRPEPSDWHREDLKIGSEAATFYRPKLQEAGITCMRCAPMAEDLEVGTDALS
ncbi:MAG: glycine cleavage system protein H [Sulfobacillus benefaciens]|uniref:Glycine cleavage system protein H n=1 Tax=Sulfobacillus benefaciens TaxID=453960 RepID=A0A2T2XIC0_9FIRM|nr:MAG: glycine cleavage system protein H [Sulfobacillus benefaciens]